MSPAKSPGPPLAAATSAHTRPRLPLPPLLSHLLLERRAPSTRIPEPPAPRKEPRALSAHSHPATTHRETSSCPVASQRIAPGIPPAPAPSADRIPIPLFAHPPAPD